MPSLIPRKLRHYRRLHPYSHPLFFATLDTIESLLKLIFLLGFGLAAYFLFKNWVLPDQYPIAAAPQNISNTSKVEQSSLAQEINEGAIKPSLPPEPEPLKTAPNVRIVANQDGIDWVRQLPPSEYIIQFAATPDKDAIMAFSRENLSTGAVIYPFKRTPSGRPVFGVAMQNVYLSLDAAQRAVEQLPASLQEAKPWIRPVNQLQKAVSDAAAG
ncbi:MAG: hypothetical protein AAF404_09555 [Pseudomonadota bacterium]